MGKSETQSFRHGNYLEMAAFPLQGTRGNVLISCRVCLFTFLSLYVLLFVLVHHVCYFL